MATNRDRASTREYYSDIILNANHHKYIFDPIYQRQNVMRHNTIYNTVRCWYRGYASYTNPPFSNAHIAMSICSKTVHDSSYYLLMQKSFIKIKKRLR